MTQKLLNLLHFRQNIDFGTIGCDVDFLAEAKIIQVAFYRGGIGVEHRGDCLTVAGKLRVVDSGLHGLICLVVNDGVRAVAVLKYKVHRSFYNL